MTALTSTPAVTPGTQLTFPHGPSWANRFALAPLTNTQSHADGTLSDDEYLSLIHI